MAYDPAIPGIKNKKALQENFRRARQHNADQKLMFNPKLGMNGSWFTLSYRTRSK